MRYWTKEETQFLVDQVTKKQRHPVDIMPELNKKFGKKRTLPSVKTHLRDKCISYRGLEVKSGESETLDIPAYTEEDMRKELSKRGYKVEKHDIEKIDRRFQIDTSTFKGDIVKFGIASCTHLCSKYQQLTFLKNFYQHASDEGCEFMLHCGDVVDGEKMYRGHEYELFVHGSKAQRDYTVEYYPKLENGGKTYMIMGTHDESFWKHSQVDIVEDIASAREDIIYLGRWGAYPQLPRLNIYMAHGSGGVAYARTYRLQKNIEQFAPAQKPDLYFLGHYHVSTALFQYRNVIALMIPCFQSQTPYLKAKGLYPEIGGFIVEVTINDKVRKDGTMGFKLYWIPFYIPFEKDY